MLRQRGRTPEYIFLSFFSTPTGTCLVSGFLKYSLDLRPLGAKTSLSHPGKYLAHPPLHVAVEPAHVSQDNVRIDLSDSSPMGHREHCEHFEYTPGYPQNEILNDLKAHHSDKRQELRAFTDKSHAHKHSTSRTPSNQLSSIRRSAPLKMLQ